MSLNKKMNAQKWLGGETMKCEYCDNSVPNGATRCPSCGAAVGFWAAEKELASSTHPVQSSMPIGALMASPSTTPPRSRVAYILIGVFFGTLGVHNFYVGRIYRGLGQLLTTLLAGWLVLPLLAVWIWSIVDICVISADGDGVRFQ